MLHVIISGGGIAGLTAAVALRRAGHRVDIYERSSMNNEIGAAIHVPPNASRFLLSWGLKPSDWGFVTAKSLAIRDPETLDITMQENNPAAAGGDGSPLYLAHRVDLHSALRTLATQEEGPGEPATIHRKSDVASFDPSAPSMTLRDGTTIHADIIVGADGVHSVAAEAVLGRKVKPVKPVHANFCYRFLIPADVVEADPDTRFYNQERDGQTRLMAHHDGKRRIVSYVCRSNTVHNFVCLFYDPDMDISREDWQTAVDVPSILERFSDFHPGLLKVVAKATAAKQFPLLYREPIERWTKDYLVLAGDSAHPMLPHQAQGGAQGMEDGVALGIALCGATSKEDARERLQVYEQLRISRASVIQILSNVGMEQLALVRDEAAKYLPEDAIPSNGAEVRKFSYSYDVVEAAIQAATRYDPAFALPADFFDGGSCKAPWLERVVSSSAKI